MFAHTRAALARFGAELRDTLPHLVVSVHAFGSRVRGDHRGDSDLDVLVVVRERTLEIERSIIDLCVEHEQRSGISFDPVIKDGNYSGGVAGMRQGGIMGRPSKTDRRASITFPPFLRIVEM